MCEKQFLIISDFYTGLPIDYDFTPNQLDDDEDVDDDGHISSAVSTISDASATLLSASDIKIEPQEINSSSLLEDEMAVLGKF